MLKIALVGPTNTGKTSLFNKLVVTTRTTISCEEHTTVDNQYGCFINNTKTYVVIDTPGFSHNILKEGIENLMIYDTILAGIQDADVLFFVLTQTYIYNKTTFSWYKSWLKKIKKPVIFLINKIDEVDFDFFIKNSAIYGVFFYAVSAKYGVGFSYLWKYVDTLISTFNKKIIHTGIRSYSFFVPRVRVALIGKENVGKSTLFNLLSRINRSSVSDKAGTTKECVYSPLLYKHLRFLFTDTVGVKVTSNIIVKFYDILLFTFDCTDFLKTVDKSVLKELFKKEKICVVLFNKCDKLCGTVQKFTSTYIQKFGFLQNFLYVMCSARYSFNIFFMYRILNFMYTKNLYFYSSHVLTKLVKDVTSVCFKVYYSKKNIIFLFAFTTKKTFSNFFIYGKNLSLLQSKHKRYIETEISKRLGNFLFLINYVFVDISIK